MKISIFGIKKQLEAQVTELTGKLEAAATEKTTLEAKIKDLEATIAQGISADQHNKVLAENKELTEQVELLAKDLEEANKKATEVDKTASQKAMEIVASAGAPTVAVPPTEQPASMVSANGSESQRFTAINMKNK